jgi:hypothetical protein
MEHSCQKECNFSLLLTVHITVILREWQMIRKYIVTEGVLTMLPAWSSGGFGSNPM